MESLPYINNYVAAFFAAFIGGEILILPVIVLVKVSSDNIFVAMTAAFMGNLSRDWLVYLIFRIKGRAILLKMPRLKPKVRQVEQLVVENDTRVFLCYRFLFGLVVLVLIVFGISGLSIRKFAAISILTNLLFIVVIGSFGYYYSEFMIEKINWVHHHKIYGIASVAILIGLYFLIKKASIYLIQANIKS